ncbi:ead/Ea22-like family protein [Enterobacter kobei]|nr:MULTISPECIES: ead/Ea22-like family protein [Enterobacter cloacae complex]EHF5001215.1 ead/Ea22-like family protein [Enterobacter asburiae]MDA4607079.1 ead/Ea22-like family protein [Enterobacter kobei]MDG9913369.1 ead/Ea22-like family protein [Enterobacter kobei]MDH0039058.1 ead/Ea22-like family protein [Enterobacter kobei]MDY3581494.1 ead/Ea22-like family protein [Enterobacter kobei]
MSNIDKHIDNQELRERAESTISILENIAGFEPSDIDGDSVELRFETEDGFDTGCDVSIVDQCQKTADVVRALLDELEAKDKSIGFLKDQLAQLANFDPDWDKLEAATDSLREHMDELTAARTRIAELEALQRKPVMFIDGDISPSDAEKLAAVISEFNEETETPAARMARIIRENPHPTNMCDMPGAGTAKGE